MLSINHMGVPEAERQGSVPKKHHEPSSQSSLEVSVLPPAEDAAFIHSATCREKQDVWIISVGGATIQ